MSYDIFDDYETFDKFEKFKIERARTKKPSLLDRIGIKDFEIPEELRKKDRKTDDPNVIANEKIGIYNITMIRLDYYDQSKDYMIVLGDDSDPISEMLKEKDFEQAVNIYLSLSEYIKTHN